MRGVILALVFAAVALAQPVNPPPAIIKGTPPGGPGGACSASNLTGYLSSTGVIYTCQSSVWTASGGSASGPAGGDLSGTYPNPSLANKNAATGPIVSNSQNSISTESLYQFGGQVPSIGFGGVGAAITGMTFLSTPTSGEFVGTGLNDMYIGTTAYTGTSPGVFVVQINTAASNDTFVWKLNNGSFSSPVTISSANTAITLGSGLQVKFKAVTGHTVGDQWIVPTVAGVIWPATLNDNGFTGMAAALAGTGSGNVTNGVHLIKMTWATWNGDSYAKPNSPLSVTVANNTVNGKIAVSSLPQSTDPKWIGTNIWMTKAGGSTYYLVGFVPKGGTTFTINRADSGMSAQAPTTFDTLITAGGCIYGEIESTDLNEGPFGSCVAQVYDYGLRFPGTSYFWDNFANGILGTSGGFQIQYNTSGTGTQVALTASPALTGTPTAPTASLSDNSTKLATTAYADRASISAAYGAYASLPVSGTRTGDQYFCSDSPYTFLWDGSAWRARWESFPVTVPPLASGLTWVNQSTSTANNTAGDLFMSVPSSGSTNIRALVKSLSAGTYTFTIGLDVGQSTANFANSGLVLRESSSGKMIVFGPQSTNTCAGQTGQLYCIQANSYTNATTFSASGPNISLNKAPRFLRVQDDGTNLIYSYSYDGQNFVTVGTAGHTAFLTANQAGIAADPENSQVLNLSVWHWSGV